MKKETRKRAVQYRFRCTEEEAEQIRKKIEKSGCTIQEYLLKGALEKEINVIDMGQIRELTVELKREGTNLNQIARNLHEGGNTYGLDKTKKELEETWQLLRQCLAKLV